MWSEIILVEWVRGTVVRKKKKNEVASPNFFHHQTQNMLSALRRVPGSRAVRLACNQTHRIARMPVRNYADKKEKSILDDDMLARAGFEEQKKPETEGPESEGPENDGQERTERSARRKGRSKTSKDLQREKYANWFYMALLFGGFAGLGYLLREWDSEEEQKKLEGTDIGSGYTPSEMYGRLSRRIMSVFSFFSEPAFENLLPPPPPEAYRRPLTLVLGVDDLLIHSSWDTKNGWRTAKRPGLDYFLGYLLQYYEIVIFSLVHQVYAERTILKLDPLRAFIQYALYREACRYKNGKLIKDLSLLNRDLLKTVALDVDKDAYGLQPENALLLDKWDGKPDTTLIDMIPLLEYLATQPLKDVRPVISSFPKDNSVIDEYKKREATLRQKWREDNKDAIERAHKPNAGSFFAKMLGLPTQLLNKEPKMPIDLVREHGQMQYEHLLKFLKENEENFLKEEQKMKEEYGKMTLKQLMTEGPPSPEDIAKAQAEKAKEA